MKANIFVKSARKGLSKILQGCCGYASYAANVLSKDIVDDVLGARTSFSQKLWAYRRGFLSRGIFDYGLNESNYKYYENDFHYYRSFPLNEYSGFIDDKMRLRYIFQPFAEFLPKYYFSLRRGCVSKLIDCPVELASDISSVISLLQREKHLAVKLLGGEGGAGFYKVSYEKERYVVNDSLMAGQEFENFLASLNNYIVTEYLMSHAFVRKFYSDAPNTLRVMIVHIPGEEPAVVGAFFRFGTAASGKVDNVSAGGMMCGVDITNGRLHSPYVQKGQQWISQDVHVDSHVRIEGDLPHWDLIINKVRDMCRFWPGLKHVGFDIVITEQGFKCIEINSQPSINPPQLFYPLLKNEHAAKLYSMVDRNKRGV